MESEEFEQIPWSGLVTQAQPAVDPRWYIAGGVVGAIVIVFLAMRLFTGSPPTAVVPILASDTLPVETMPVVTAEPVTAVGDGEITEADLMAVDPPSSGRGDAPIVGFVAEWFVTDYFTRDGSTETISSLQAVLNDADMASALPHLGDSTDETFVEWARAFAYAYPLVGLAEVSVALRTVHRGEDGFVRDPVRAVVVEIVDWETDPKVAGLPVDIDLP